MEIFNTDSFDFLDKKTRKILLESRESFIPHTPYLYEKNMLEAVRMGDADLAEERLHLMGNYRKSRNFIPKPSASGADYHDFLYYTGYPGSYGRRSTRKSGLCHE